VADGSTERAHTCAGYTAEVDFDLDAAGLLPPNLRFGCSSWKYEGWKGQIYRREYKTKKAFEAESLREYAEFPWFRAIGMDHTFYTPPRVAHLDGYVDRIPKDMVWLAKVWDRVTIPKYRNSRRYGDLAGKENPHFLDPVLFREEFLAPFERQDFLAHTGPFMFQFQDVYRSFGDLEEFAARLDRFLGAIPERHRYAIEVRTPQVLDTRYFEVLADHGATHVFNHWGTMPPLVDQMRKAAEHGGIRAGFYVARLLTPRGLSYQRSVDRFSPYDRLQQVQPEMRRDVVRLAKRAVETGADAYILVNNRVEGNSPRTIDALGAMIVDSLGLR